MSSIGHVDEARFSLFTKILWKGIYENTQGYTVIIVPSYFDYVKLKGFMSERNQSVAMISEYTDKKMCQRLRTSFEMRETDVLIITERALVF